MKSIHYKTNESIDLNSFVSLYQASTLGERRPLDNLQIMQQMKDNANLTISAWDGDKLVGLARTLTDFGYVAYVADLAVDSAYQQQGIGKQLLAYTQAELGEQCMLVLLAAPKANEYYPKIGFEHNPRAWTRKPA